MGPGLRQSLNMNSWKSSCLSLPAAGIAGREYNFKCGNSYHNCRRFFHYESKQPALNISHKCLGTIEKQVVSKLSFFPSLWTCSPAGCNLLVYPAFPPSHYKAVFPQQFRQPYVRADFCFELKQLLIQTKSQVNLGIVVLSQTAVILHD